MKTINSCLRGSIGALCLCAPSFANAASVVDYLIVGQEIDTTAVDVSNFELGRVSALAASAPTDFGTVGVGPSVSNTPTYDGNVAIIDATGQVKLSNIVVYADRGIDCTGSYDTCTDEGSNFSNSQYDEGPGIPGLRPIGPNPDGVNENQDLTGVSNQINDVNTYVNGLDDDDITGTINTTGGDINSDQVISLSSGLNILDFDVSMGTDITVKSNLIFDGAADAFAIVLVPDGSAFKTSQGNLLIGDGGILLFSVLIVSTDSNKGFDLSNTNINGVSLWDLGSLADMSLNMSLDNVSGCTQLVGGDVDIQNVRLSNCGFDVTVIPLPPAVWLFGTGLLGLVGMARRKKAA